MLSSGLTLGNARDLCQAAKVPWDDKLERIVNTMSAEGISRVELGRSGDSVGVDLFIEPTQPAKKPTAGEIAKSEAAN